MKYQLTIQTDDTEELERLLSRMVRNYKAEQVSEKTEPVKQKKAAKKGSQLEFEVAQSENGKAEDNPAVEDDEDTGEDDVTLESIQEKSSKKAQAGHRDKIKLLLKKFDASKITELEESDYEAFNAGLDKIK